jgi:hypothetical protein
MKGRGFSRAVRSHLIDVSSRAERPQFFPTRVLCESGGRVVEGPAFRARSFNLSLLL